MTLYKKAWEDMVNVLASYIPAINVWNQSRKVLKVIAFFDERLKIVASLEDTD